MAILKWVIVFFAVMQFGFMLYDGSRALVVGDYIRPSSGEHAGQLGPWHKIVSVVGIDPESTLMKIIFVVWGLAGLCITVAFILNTGGSARALLIANICSTWYLVVGTATSVLQIILLLVMRSLR